jgi:hypothetical protein
MSLVALNPSAHKALKINPQQVPHIGANAHLIPVVVSEFQKLVVNYPIVFTKHADTGQFVCSALTGFSEGENLFWQEGSWQALYIPAQIERHPFFVGQDTDAQGNAKPVICFDDASPAIADADGDALFNDDGTPTSLLNEKQQLLAQLLDGEQQTQQFIDALLSHALITPIKLAVTFADGSEHAVQGLFTIDEEKLSQLSAEAIASLHAGQWLGAIYTLIASTAQIYALIDRKNQRIEHGNAWFS